jgi:hypothetical protein
MNWVAVDRWVHRVLRGRCYNRWLCERLSYSQAVMHHRFDTDIKETEDPS